MPTMEDVEALIWRSVLPDVEYNADSAILKKWRALKADNTPIGVPVTHEVPLDDGHVAQGFTSGCVLVWVGGDQVEVR